MYRMLNAKRVIQQVTQHLAGALIITRWRFDPHSCFVRVRRNEKSPQTTCAFIIFMQMLYVKHTTSIEIKLHGALRRLSMMGTLCALCSFYLFLLKVCFIETGQGALNHKHS